MNLNRPWIDLGYSYTHSSKRFIDPDRRKENFNSSYTKLLLYLMAHDIPIYIIDTGSFERPNMYLNFPFLRKYKKCKGYMINGGGLFEEGAKLLGNLDTPVNLVTSKINTLVTQMVSMLRDTNPNTKTVVHLQMSWCTCNYFDNFSIQSYNSYKQELGPPSNRSLGRLLKYEFD